MFHEQPDVQVLPRPLPVLEISTSAEEGTSSHIELDEGESNSQQLGIWAARGLLLLVAAIWGTNFAVSRLSMFTCSISIQTSTKIRAHIFDLNSRASSI